MPVHYETPTPKCPHCGHDFTQDDMVDDVGADPLDDDLFSIAPHEDSRAAKCPVCDGAFWVRGGFDPKYTTAFAEDDL